MFLVYGGEDELVVRGYTNASFQTNKDDFRSQYGYVFILNRGVVSWKSSKQETVVDSTTETEYIAASEASKENVWVRDFISLLGVVLDSANPLDLYCDNSGAITLAREPWQHQKSKHIERRYHLIQNFIEGGDINVCKVHTYANVADPLTKPLLMLKHEAHVRAIVIRCVTD